MKRSMLFLVCLVLGLPLFTWADGIIMPPLDMPRLAIRYHHVDVNIDNQIATTHVDQVFVNESPWRMEGTYLFPLPDDVSITEFAMYVEGERLPAELLDAETARQIYEDIVRSQRDPALLEYVGRNLFRARIFPIEPHSEKRVELTYSEFLQADAGLVQYRYPLNTEKFSTKPLQSVWVDVDLQSVQPLKNIYSPSHKVAVERQGERSAQIRYDDEDVLPDTDFLLYYTFTNQDFGLNLLTHRVGDEPGFYAMLLAPQVEPPEGEVIRKNLVFVLDTSGSMRQDSKIEQAKEALRFVLQGLRPEDSFNLVDFSSEARQFRPEPSPASSDNVEAALQYVDQIEAVGGTNIDEALVAALKQESELVNMLIFLTDGMPTVGETSVDGILKSVQAHNQAQMRLFVFGVGYDVNTHLLDQLASETRGISDYVLPHEDIEVKVSSFYTKISEPVLSGLDVNWGTLQVQDLYPKVLPDLFAGAQIVQFGRYTQAGNGAVLLSGQINSVQQEYAYDATFPQQETAHEFIPRLWATRKIGYLLDQIRLNGESQELVDEVVRLSKRYGVITPYTSFLITEDEFTPPPPGHFDQQLAADSGEAAVDSSLKLGGLRDADTADNSTPTETLRLVGSKSFFLRHGFWTDSGYVDQPTLDLDYGSDAYFDLLTRTPELGRYLALGTQIIVLWEGQAYRVIDTQQTSATEQPWDTNSDGVVDIFDLVTVGQRWGQKGGTGDLNGDGIIDIADLVLLGQHFGERYDYQPLAAPVSSEEGTLVLETRELSDGVIEVLLNLDSPARVSGFTLALHSEGGEIISLQAGSLMGDTPYRLGTGTDSLTVVHLGNTGRTGSGTLARILLRGGQPVITRLQIVDDQLRAVAASFGGNPFAPRQTGLGQNYPNPCNPETWIPYHIAEDTEAELVIHDSRGYVIRRMDLGTQEAGDYTSRERAIYWDGRDGAGDRVASGLYFYRLITEQNSDTRRLLLRK